jgi:phosphoribosylformylglycinamidine synthase
MGLLHLYRKPALSPNQESNLLVQIDDVLDCEVASLDTEFCFNIELDLPLGPEGMAKLRWLLAETFEPEGLQKSTQLSARGELFEVGPRMNFSTAWSTNAVAICHACSLSGVKRIERSRRYLLGVPRDLRESERKRVLPLIHDRMTECEYPEPLQTFETGMEPRPVFRVPVMENGKRALREISRDMGLAFDEWDIDYYYRLFAHDLKRDPTNVECFDVAQSNSEHSRHWFFKGRLVIDGEEIESSLLDMIQDTLRANPGNSVIAYEDNSSAIRGFNVSTIVPSLPGEPSPFVESEPTYDVIFTAETHNFPTGVAPFPGAETGTGGRIRDVHATGRGALVVAGTAAYCVGNLNIPGYKLPWEQSGFTYPDNLSSPLDIEIEASNGASDYGNKFGEPLIQGFTRSFGLTLPSGERREWVKPIMFTGGVGQIDSDQTRKGTPRAGMMIAKIGGPAYRIGMGGGAASSMIQGENVAELDFNAVQRGDAEMEQKVNRAIRACVELGEDNPIVSIHDQGAGGNCNVVKEIVYPAGGRVEIREIMVGDETLSVLEIWGAEYQEQDAILARPEKVDQLRAICQREKVPLSIIGRVTGDGRIVVHDRANDSTPVNLALDKVLGKMPRKVFELESVDSPQDPLEFPPGLTVDESLSRVLRLLSVGSKRFLTNKVDRSVTGLVAQQQCAGPLQLTVSDVAVIAQSHFDHTGAAIAIGEQPIKGLIDPAAMARLSVGEALTNIVWAANTGIEDVKCSANWMWAPKIRGEGVKLVEAARAMSEAMKELGIAVDGGKDSLSMAAVVPSPTGDADTVISPGELTVSAYVTCPDIDRIVTPDIKHPGRSLLVFVDLGSGHSRLGGSALAHVYGQTGMAVPDLEEPKKLAKAFTVLQDLISRDLVEAGHDRSDGGLITTVLEMAFSGDCGIELDLCPSMHDPLPALFSEELGLVMEVLPENSERVVNAFKRNEVPCRLIGRTTVAREVIVKRDGKIILDRKMTELRDLWEETSYRLELLQANPKCVEQERESLFSRHAPEFKVTFDPKPTPSSAIRSESKPRVAIIREEGSNGDREMASAFHMAGFEAWDITMTDLLEGTVRLDRFQGIAFVGGFSYADVLDSAKGWAGVIRYNEDLWDQFQRYYRRPDTFSLGVCNGCQLMALLGWVPWPGITSQEQPRFIRNESGRFESRFVSVRVLPSPSIMLSGMEESVLGIWVAHGEGRAHFPDRRIFNRCRSSELAPLRYVDDDGEVTKRYPFNPNGSLDGIAALCSEDGRHLAMMPHPERAFLKWQWPWLPREIGRMRASPWLRLFQNARVWLENRT